MRSPRTFTAIPEILILTVAVGVATSSAYALPPGPEGAPPPPPAADPPGGGLRSLGSTCGRRGTGISPAYVPEGLESGGGTTEPPPSTPAEETPVPLRARVSPRLRSARPSGGVKCCAEVSERDGCSVGRS